MANSRGAKGVVREPVESAPRRGALRSMPSAAVATAAPVRLSQEEARSAFDEQARCRLGMSGEEFLAAWDSDRLDGLDESDVMWVASLLPLVHPASA
jgi:hypothetical protein